MNIYEKLIEVRKSVPYLKKDDAGYRFKYVSSSQTLGALREAMDTNQLLLIPRMLSHEIRDHTTREGNHNYLADCVIEFTWVNAEKPEETITCPWDGLGLDDGEKCIGKACTYAEKYFLLKFFNVATDKDDPDSFQGKQEKQKLGRKENKSKEPDFLDRQKEPDEMEFNPLEKPGDDPMLDKREPDGLSDNEFKKDLARKQKRSEFFGMLKELSGGDIEKGKENLFRQTGQTSKALVTNEMIDTAFDKVRKIYYEGKIVGESK